MKIPMQLLNQCKALITPLDTPERRERYIAGDFPRSAGVQDLDTRYRWDLYWASGASANVFEWAATRGVDDLKDAHVDTMLRRIVPMLGQEERAS